MKTCNGHLRGGRHPGHSRHYCLVGDASVGVHRPAGQTNSAADTLNRIVGCFNFSQAWMQKQNNLSAQAASQINARMQDTFRLQQSFMQKLNSVDENFESMDELISGYSTYHDPANW